MKYLVKIFVITFLIFGFKHAYADNHIVYVDMDKILNESKDEGGVYYIEILAKIAQFELSEIAKRKRIAIIPFRINQNNFSINDNIFSSADFKDLLNHELTTYFVQTKKFTVLDREFNKEIIE